jgi:tripartite-type tricarboxylate transporter receptor subunit TctC
MHRSIVRLLAVAALAPAVQLAAVDSGDARADQFPVKPVKVVVPFPAGGAVDTVMRAVGQKLTEIWKQQVLIENRAGVGGNMGADYVAKSPGDGYTYLITTHGYSISPSLYKKLPFDPVKDLQPVTQLTSSYTVLTASPQFGAKTLKQLIQLAKEKPGAINYGSSGIGAPLHLVMELIKSQAGIDITHVPYKGDAEIMSALTKNEVQVAIMPVAGAMAPIRDGRLNALGITSLKRAKVLPDVPTLDEAGLPGFQYVGWLGIFAPAAVPRPIIDQAQKDFAKALSSPDLLERLPGWGYEPVANTPEQFAARVRSDIALNAKAIKDAKVPMQE